MFFHILSHIVKLQTGESPPSDARDFHKAKTFGCYGKGEWAWAVPAYFLGSVGSDFPAKRYDDSKLELLRGSGYLVTGYM